MKTVFEHVTEWMDRQACKHDLGVDYAERSVNGYSNWELLQAISNAVEQRLADERAQ